MEPIAIINDGTYVAGGCNISRAEVRRRRDAAVLASGATVAVAAALLAVDATPAWRLVIGVPAFFALLGIAQARSRFCVAFALAGVRDTSPDGGRVAVSAPGRRTDLRRAARMVAASFAGAAAIAVSFAALPI